MTQSKSIVVNTGPLVALCTLLLVIMLLGCSSAEKPPPVEEVRTFIPHSCEAGGGIVNINRFNFDFNRADLTIAQKQHLCALAVNAGPRGFQALSIKLEGHTDSQERHRPSLSIRRAQNIAEHLISQGIDPAIIQAKGFSDSVPIAPNRYAGGDYPEGRAQNRRVDIQITEIKYRFIDKTFEDMKKMCDFISQQCYE